MHTTDLASELLHDRTETETQMKLALDVQSP